MVGHLEVGHAQVHCLNRASQDRVVGHASPARDNLLVATALAWGFQASQRALKVWRIIYWVRDQVRDEGRGENGVDIHRTSEIMKGTMPFFSLTSILKLRWAGQQVRMRQSLSSMAYMIWSFFYKKDSGLP